MALTVICCAILSTVALAYANPACKFVEHPEKALSSDYSAFITGAATLQACMDILSRGRHEVVAFNHVTHECCSVPTGLHYNFVDDTQWTAYTLSPTTSTSASVHVTTTASQASAPATAGKATLLNSTTVDGVTLALYTLCNYSDYSCEPVTWDEAASMCRSIGWWLAQLTTDKLFNAAENIGHPHYISYYPYVGARFNETSGDYEWTKSNTAVRPSFWYSGAPYPNAPYASYSVTNLGIPAYSGGLYNFNPSWTAKELLCTSE